MAEERISELGDTSRETKLKSNRKTRLKRKKKRTEYSRTVGQFKKYDIQVIGIPEGLEKENHNNLRSSLVA